MKKLQNFKTQDIAQKQGNANDTTLWKYVWKVKEKFKEKPSLRSLGTLCSLLLKVFKS